MIQTQTRQSCFALPYDVRICCYITIKEHNRNFDLRLILLILICLPLLEIAILVMVGSNIGVIATIGLVIFTGFLGSYLLRAQGLSAFVKLRQEMMSGRVPDKHLADTAMIVLAGIMLIIPGFISDVIGILLFIPFVRRWLLKSFAGRVNIVRTKSGIQETIIELDESEFHRTSEGSDDQNNSLSQHPNVKG